MTFTVTEQTSARYTGTLTDETGAVVSSAVLTSAQLTLYDDATGTILNSRNAQNVLNANGVTITTAGVLTWLLDPADNAIISATTPIEKHRAVFSFVWGARRLVHEVVIQVKNIRMVS